MRRFQYLIFIVVILFELVWLVSARAQGGKGAISGLVTDDNGAVLKGAQVTLESPVLNVVSDEQGRFYINDVPPGSYTLTICVRRLCEISATRERVRRRRSPTFP